MGLDVRPDTRVHTRHFRVLPIRSTRELSYLCSPSLALLAELPPLNRSAHRFITGVSHAQGIAIASRHALITAAELTVAPNQADWWRTAQELVKKLPGERYGSLEGVHALVESLSGTKAKRMQELLDWLKREM